MSAWIVSRNHINFLVAALAARGIIEATDEAKTEAGRALWKENHASVNYRYNENTRTPQYTFKAPKQYADRLMDDFFVAKQAACYDYQTCEHREYETSWAKRVIDKLPKYTDAHDRVLASTNAPWGID